MVHRKPKYAPKNFILIVYGEVLGAICTDHRYCIGIVRSESLEQALLVHFPLVLYATPGIIQMEFNCITMLLRIGL
jgi:hypothetical protein